MIQSQDESVAIAAFESLLVVLFESAMGVEMESAMGVAIAVVLEFLLESRFDFPIAVADLTTLHDRSVQSQDETFGIVGIEIVMVEIVEIVIVVVEIEALLEHLNFAAIQCQKFATIVVAGRRVQADQAVQ